MHYPPKNYVNNLGFIGPPGAPTETSGGVPIVGYTSRSGWAARPILATGYYQPTIVATGPVQPPQYDSGLPPDYLPYTPTTMSAAEIQAMRDRLISAQQELLERQTREGGDGIDFDLEQKAAEDLARERAIEAGEILPTGAARPAPNLIPLAIGAALIFFMNM